MKLYKNLGGDSGVDAYDYGNDRISIRFDSRAIYTYTYTSAGSGVIETMKNLGDQGHGLHSYISTNKPGYSSKC